MATPQPFYTTNAAELGISGQQAGWDRLLSMGEIRQVSLGYTNNQVLACTGAVQQFVVPADVYQVRITSRGACGYRYPDNPTGWGAKVRSVHNVYPGQVLDVYVGCVPTGARDRDGGWPNGGTGGQAGGGAGSDGKGGGGSSHVVEAGGAFADLWQIAGGGGGGGTASYAPPAGDGGYPTGVTGSGGSSGNGGTGGTQVAGGTGGTGAGGTGVDGASNLGGDGGVGTSLLGDGGGGGGGGWFGGGGGGGNNQTAGTGNGQGGGGSSHVGENAQGVEYGIADPADGHAGSVEFEWTPGYEAQQQIQVPVWTEDFQGITPGQRVDTSADWVETVSSANHWYASASGANSIDTTSDTEITHQTTLPVGSKYIKVNQVKGGVSIKLQGYLFGIYYYNSPTTSWYRCIREGGSYRDLNTLQIPDDNTAVDMLIEIIEEGANRRFRLWIDDVLWSDWLDTTPPAEDGDVGLYVDGRGSTAIGYLTSIEAGRLV